MGQIKAHSSESGPGYSPAEIAIRQQAVKSTRHMLVAAIAVGGGRFKANAIIGRNQGAEFLG